MPTLAELLAQSHLRLRALDDTVARLRPASRNSISARFLLNLCREALGGLRQQLAGLPQEGGPSAEVVEGVMLCANLIHVLLAFVDAAAGERVPQALAAPLQHLLGPLVGPSRMLVYYDWRPGNYSFRRKLPTQLRSLLSEALESPNAGPADQEHPAVQAVPPIFAVLTLPAAEQSNVLLHSLLAHEVGHALVEHSPVPLPDLPPNLQNPLARLLLSRWQSELLADAWSVFLLGPAPLLSLIELSTHHRASEDHPCNFIRFQLMQGCLASADFVNPGQQSPADLGWLSDTIANALAASEPFQPDVEEPNSPFAPAHTFLLAHLPAIADPVYANDGAYTRAMWDSECYAVGEETIHNALVWRILHCAPPDWVDPTAQQPHLGSVLTAGWAVRMDPANWSGFRSCFSLPESQSEYRSLQRLNQLLLKAIEVTAIRRQWQG